VPITELDPRTILYEDNHCLAINKPPRLLTVGDRTGHTNLLDLAKDYLKRKYRKPGDVFLGVVHRLDRPVSGVVLFARTSKAASRLADQFRTRSMDKVYWAVVGGQVVPSKGTLEDWIYKEEDENLSKVTPPNAPGSKRCVLRYEEIPLAGGPTLLEVRPETGRSHQIRVQLATRKWPIAGDRKYGSTFAGGGTIGLHAVELTFIHPTQQEPITLSAAPPESWQKWNPRVGAWFAQCHRK
jgi:23S rRNA pseudouridine1911/1915/1917 synthase